MPELPEVTLVAEQLHQECAGWTLSKVRVREQKIFSGLDKLQGQLPLTITNVRNKAKYILFTFENRTVLMSHLRMTGHWTLHRPNRSRVTLTLQNGSETKKLFYEDSRGFGEFEFARRKIMETRLETLAPTIPEDSVDDKVQRAKLHPRCFVYTLILDQTKVLSGVGNYIANEALYRAGIAPRSKIGDIPTKRLRKLFVKILKIFQESYERNGVSISDFYDIYDRKGKFQKRLRVYRQSHCPLGFPVECDEFGRGNCYWVPQVQKWY